MSPARAQARKANRLTLAGVIVEVLYVLGLVSLCCLMCVLAYVLAYAFAS